MFVEHGKVHLMVVKDLARVVEVAVVRLADAH